MRTIRPVVKIHATKKYCEIHGKDNGCAFMMPEHYIVNESHEWDCTLFRGYDRDFIPLENDGRGVLRCQECLDSEVQ